MTAQLTSFLVGWEEMLNPKAFFRVSVELSLLNGRMILRWVSMKIEQIGKTDLLSKLWLISRKIRVIVIRAASSTTNESENPDLQKKQVNDESFDRNKKFRGVHSSRFVSYRAQLSAYNEALTREARKMSRFTGEDCKGNLVVRMEAENIGEGYEPNPSDPNDPRYIPQMNGFEMRFDFETLKPWAFYPVEKV
jgi:hypothetical protein